MTVSESVSAEVLNCEPSILLHTLQKSISVSLVGYLWTRKTAFCFGFMNCWGDELVLDGSDTRKGFTVIEPLCRLLEPREAPECLCLWWLLCLWLSW